VSCFTWAIRICAEMLIVNSDFDREYDMTKMYATGFEEERTPLDAWGVVFDRMRAAKMIPPA
jgi:hypothetical protein